jgi:hypothetical protein
LCLEINGFSTRSWCRVENRWSTLCDAAEYITELPKAEHDVEARIGIMRALNRHAERVFDPSRKDTHWVTRKLKRDQ